MKKSVLFAPTTKFYLVILGFSLIIAIGLSPFASNNPDGLDRVAQDLKIDHRAKNLNNPLGKPLANYKLQGVPDSMATPLAGLIGTLMTFGLTWGFGHVIRKKSVDSLSKPPEKIL